jgi:TldD protein
MAHTQRVEFPQDLAELRAFLPSLLPVLGANPDWYPSIWFERKARRAFSASLKETDVSRSRSSGLVMRIYDGRTLHEFATESLETEALRESARQFSKRVAASASSARGTIRLYRAPSWSERMKSITEPEIQTQLPASPRTEVPVHFGSRYQRDPRVLSDADAIGKLREILERVRRESARAGLSDSELNYAAARYGFSTEESFFIDREVNLSQSLFRVAATVVAMSGSNRTVHQEGGLGGLEAVDIPDHAIREMMVDLHALRAAERIRPGKYRILCSPEISGVLAHEAFGHAQEGDTCARGRSKAWELHREGARVGNEHATILNNPALFENAGKPWAAWGSYFFDEEGWISSEQVLLDRGLLRAPMTNLTSAIRLGVPRTANGKRESWANGVYTRQTNTYFSAGDMTFKALLTALGDGFVAIQSAGGMEDPKGMGIQVGIAWLKEVRNGELTGRVFRGPAGGDINLTGFVPDVLSAIEAKSKIESDSELPDSARHPWNDTGGCGKYHKEFVHAGCGGPWMLLNGVNLG